MRYTLQAEFTDHNGMSIDSTGEETLGCDLGVTYATREDAEAARDNAQVELEGCEGYADTRITVEEAEVFDFTVQVDADAVDVEAVDAQDAARGCSEGWGDTGEPWTLRVTVTDRFGDDTAWDVVVGMAVTPDPCFVQP